ncbi:hypothetical protein CONLIGDRAFT_690714 [Coniochaeta ligniaria NRRL 30616]|uniref:Uncharacterized protein n=1 Tax=Coniochaeta ligniaria NRRL 30616 TaxID=1408157 RepID=A0A1J7J769_9PEZI|nr:hypothetical protein CONLIGDRAFT_690714 [Coniochaeta ligniaria NRRL 30616]
MNQYYTAPESPVDTEGGAVLSTPATPILTPMSPDGGSPISEFWLDESSSGDSQETYKTFNLTVELADKLPTAGAEPVLAVYTELPSRPGSANSDHADNSSSGTPVPTAEIDTPMPDVEIDDMNEDFADLNITDLTLDEIDVKIITLSDDLLNVRLQYRNTENLDDASKKWMAHYMEGLNAKIEHLRRVKEVVMLTEDEEME